MRQNKHRINDKGNTPIQSLGLKLTILYLFVVPMMNGLFREDFMQLAWMALLGLLIFFTVKQARWVIDKKVAIIFTGQFFLGIISIFTGVNTEGALSGFFRYLLPILAFFLALNVPWIKGESKNTARTFEKSSPKEPPFFQCGLTKIYWPLLLSGLVIAVVNLLSFATWDGSGELQRTEKIITYANTLAIYMFACSLMGFYLLFTETLRWKKTILRFLLCLNLVVIVITFSRMVWILSIAIYIVYFVLHYKEKLYREFLKIAVLSMMILSAVFIVKSFKMILVLVFMFLALGIFHLWDRWKWKDTGIFRKYMKPTVVFSIVVGGILILGFKSELIMDRIQSINLNASELQSRFAYYRDAVHIFKDYPVVGTGPGGWDSLQHEYQTVYYATKHVHSSAIQVLLDYGAIGFLLFAAQFVLFIGYSLKALQRYKAQSEMKLFIHTLTLINSAFLLHSFLDIDFEFPLITMMFWIHLAVLSKLSGTAVEVTFKRPSFAGVVRGGLLVLIVVQIPLFISNRYYLHGVERYRVHEFDSAQEHFENATRFNPISSKSYYMLGETMKMLYTQEMDALLKEKSLESFEMAQRYDPKSPKYPAGKTYLYKISNELDKSIEEYRQLIERQPLIIGYYEDMVRMMYEKAQRDEQMGNKESAVAGYNGILKVEKEIKQTRMKISPYAHKIKQEWRFEITPELSKAFKEVSEQLVAH